MGSPRRRYLTVLLTLVSVSIAAFWVWALFFAPRSNVAKLDDTAWAERAEQICQQANTERAALVDTRRIDDAGPDALAERAAIVDRATAIVEQMLDDVVAATPTGTDDAALLSRWEEYYRTLIDNRRAYTDVLRSGENPPFREGALDGVPISEFINDFTIANRMKSCAAPADLAV
ncbi:MAG: hypothetical protein WAS51_17730 [Ilumatobacteraceae bacterium]|nr:MAG: hypothetical protein IPM43_15125 [Actinomycetota bacterium]